MTTRSKLALGTVVVLSALCLLAMAKPPPRRVAGCKPPALTLAVPAAVTETVPFTAAYSAQPATGQPGCGVSAWVLDYGDGGTRAGTGRVTATDQHAYATEGTYPVSLSAQTLTGVSASADQFVTSGALFPSGPPAGSLYGPQASITCPVGAVSVTGNSAALQSAITANPTGTAFCLSAAVHTVTGAVTPKTGNTFVGAYGAILDATGWTSTDPFTGVFRAHSPDDIDNVTIKNLVIRNAPKAVHTLGLSTNWIIEYNEITANHVGVTASDQGIVRHNWIHHNINNPTDPTPGNRGGGYGGYRSTNILFDTNDISYNGPEQKVLLSSGTTFRNNFVHHNYADGLWMDSDNTATIYENNRIEDNGRWGIHHEVSGDAIVRNNTFARNVDRAMLVATSFSVETYGNTFTNDTKAVEYFVNCAIAGTSGDFITYDLRDNSTHNNAVTLATGDLAMVLGSTSCDAGQLLPYTNGSKNLTFQANTYVVPNVSTAYWFWGGVSKTFTQWKALGHDLTGSVTAGP